MQREPLERLQEIFGGTIRMYDDNRPTHQPVFRWTASGARARGVMMTLFTFMSPRRKQQIADVLTLEREAHLG